MKKILIYGAGGHAAVVSDLLTGMRDFEIVGFIDDDFCKDGKQLYGYPIIGNPGKFININKDGNVNNMFIAIGDNKIRESLSIMFADFNFPTIVHTAAIIGNEVEIGCGTIIMPGAIVDAQAKIGQHCIINNRAIVGHGSIVEDFCHISGGAILSGQTIVKKGAFIGIGSCITQKNQIGQNCIIGAGTIITKNVPDNSFMFGNPARKVSNYLSNA